MDSSGNSGVIVHYPPVKIDYQVILYVHCGLIYCDPPGIPYHILAFSIQKYHECHRRETTPENPQQVNYYRLSGYDIEQIHKHPETSETIKMIMGSMSL
jgi:hypothetical protein